jgi:hypothetical protein
MMVGAKMIVKCWLATKADEDRGEEVPLSCDVRVRVSEPE